ncbi:MAG: MGMT family protein [Candidatus Omnitrophica bacterium]|nr:MGMT family protein [Candidatus Omnitrophota bacterium]
MTSFQIRVYQAVLRIPLGQVRSYKWVATKAGSPRACRAVGQIMKKNPYPLIIPCHRVIRSDKNIGGYSRGVRYKKMLLNLEKKLARTLHTKPNCFATHISGKVV